MKNTNNNNNNNRKYIYNNNNILTVTSGMMIVISLITFTELRNYTKRLTTLQLSWCNMLDPKNH